MADRIAFHDPALLHAVWKYPVAILRLHPLLQPMEAI